PLTGPGALSQELLENLLSPKAAMVVGSYRSYTDFHCRYLMYLWNKRISEEQLEKSSYHFPNGPLRRHVASTKSMKKRSQWTFKKACNFYEIEEEDPSLSAFPLLKCE
ncbi:14681_t:CDS:2, partial [Dentiscutata heterogama]